MVFFSNAQGTNVQIVADPVNQGSVNANEVIFVGPFAPSNTVTVTYRTPGGISLTPRILSLVDGAQIIDGVEYNAWTVLLDAAVTEFSGTVTAMFSITASEGTTIVTNPAYFEVREGVYIEPPADPSADVWGKILTAMTTTNERIDNVILTNAKQSKAISDNKAAIEEIDGKVTAHSAQIKDLQDTKLDKQTGETANHMVYAKTPDGAQEMLPFPSGTIANIKDGEPVGSLEQLSSEAQGEYDTAFGFNNVTSVKGYYIQKVRFTSDSTQLLIGDTQVNPIEVSTTELVPSSSFTAPLWDVGDEVCIVAHYHYDFCAKITSIQNNLITLDKNLDGGYIGKVVAELNKEDNAIYVPTKPEAGIISLLHSAASTGFDNKAVGKASFASGAHNLAAGDYSHVEGLDNEAAYASHAEGKKTSARGECAHTEGVGTSTTADYAHAEGLDTKASAKGSHAEGWQSVASGEYSHAEGHSNATACQSHSENNSTASGQQSHAEGAAIASGKRSHAENEAKAEGANSHAEGSSDALAKGAYSHAEGGGKAYGTRSHAEGSGVTGQSSGAAGAWEAHAECAGVALGVQSHAEGNGTVASGMQSHVEGVGNTASGKASHAQGIGNTATAEGQFVAGRYAKEGQNGLGDAQEDSTMIVRIGAGTNTDHQTVFSIDGSGTVCMRAAMGSTAAISLPSHFITKEYADAHYGGGEAATYTKASVGVSLWFAGDDSVLIDQAEVIPALSQDGFFYFKDYGGDNVGSYSITYVSNMYSTTTKIKFVLAPFSRYRRPDYQPESGTVLYNYMFPNYYEGTFTEQDGKYRFDGVIYYVKKG